MAILVLIGVFGLILALCGIATRADANTVTGFVQLVGVVLLLVIILAGLLVSIVAG